MSAPEQSDWIEWAGGECPLPKRTLVQVRFRDGEESSEGNLSTAGFWADEDDTWNNWIHADCEADIIAYRVVSK